MVYGLIHGIITLMLMLIFAGIVWWAYSKKQKPRFDEAANLPFADEPVLKKQPPPQGGEHHD